MGDLSAGLQFKTPLMLPKKNLYGWLADVYSTTSVTYQTGMGEFPKLVQMFTLQSATLGI